MICPFCGSNKVMEFDGVCICYDCGDSFECSEITEPDCMACGHVAGEHIDGACIVDDCLCGAYVPGE